MNNLWLKIKIWTKVSVFSLFILYGLLLIYNNSGEPVLVWVWFGKTYKVPVLLLIFSCLLIGVIATLLVRTVLKTIRQLREMRDRTQADKEARDMADMKSKAAMLQTRPDATE
jgi:uncharacterized integral membrane protein